MKRKLIELVLLATSLALTGSIAPGQNPPAEPAQTEAPKPEPNTAPVKIIAGVLLVVIIGIIIMRRKGKKKTDDEF